MVGPPIIGAVYDLAAGAGLAKPQFWALAHPLLLLGLAWKMLVAVPGLEAASVEPLLQDAGKSQPTLFARALGVYVSVGTKAWTLALLLVCVFGCSSAAITATAINMHRCAYSSTAIGLTAIPAGLTQSLVSQWAGHFASSAKNREAVLLGCPGMLSIMAICVATVSYFSRSLLLPIILILITCSAANGAVDPTSMSMMADLAKAESIGYGQAVTASEMAVALGLGMGPCLAHVMRDEDLWSLCSVIGLCALLSCAASVRTLRGIPHNEHDGACESNDAQ